MKPSEAFEELRQDRGQLLKLTGRALAQAVDLEQLVIPLGQCLRPSDFRPLTRTLRKLRLIAYSLDGIIDEAAADVPSAASVDAAGKVSA